MSGTFVHILACACTNVADKVHFQSDCDAEWSHISPVACDKTHFPPHTNTHAYLDLYRAVYTHTHTHMLISHIFQRAVAYNMGMQQHVTNGMPVALCGSPNSRV